MNSHEMPGGDSGKESDKEEKRKDFHPGKRMEVNEVLGRLTRPRSLHKTNVPMAETSDTQTTVVQERIRELLDKNTKLLDEYAILNNLSMELIRFIRDKSQQLKKRIKALSVNTNPVLLDSMLPLLFYNEQKITDMEAAVADWENDIRDSAEHDSQIRRLMLEKPERLLALEQRGTLQRREELTKRAFESFPKKQAIVDDFFITFSDNITRIEDFIKSYTPMPDYDMQNMLEDRLKFEPGFENN